MKVISTKRRLRMFGGDLHNGQDLEKIVFGKVLVRMMFMQLRVKRLARPYGKSVPE